MKQGLEKKKISTLLILISITAAFTLIRINYSPFSTENERAPISIDFPNISSIASNNITGLESTLERVVGIMKVNVDLSGSIPTNDDVNMTISFSNGTSLNYSMTLNAGNNRWEYNFIPQADAPLGLSSLMISFHDGSQYQYSSINQFQIINSPPQIGIMISDYEIYRNETLYFNITPSDAENALSDLIWNSTIYQESSSTAITEPLSSLVNNSYFFAIDDDFGNYFIEANISDSDGNSSTSRMYFSVLNNNPIINGSYIEISDSLYTNPLNDELLRVSGTLEIYVNISDVEHPDVVDGIITEDPEEKLRLKIEVIGPVNNRLSFNSHIEIIADVIDENSHFKCAFSIPSNQPAGIYTLSVTVYELISNIEYGTTEEFEFIVINNVPDASNATLSINELDPFSSNGLRFYEYELLTFSINVTDTDAEKIDRIRLCLVNEANQWLNFSFQNPNENYLEFTIRAWDLMNGQWYAYIYVIDSDGVERGTSYGNVVSFDIISDEFSIFIPYFMLILGLLFGLGIGIVIIGLKYIGLKREYDKNIEEQITPREMQKISKSKKQSDIQKTIEPLETSSEESSDPSEKKKRKLMRKIK